MMLKKQTVWLLTMLSLIVVLSVYALTSGNPSSDQTAGNEQNAENVSGDISKEEAAATDAEKTLAEIELSKSDERRNQQEKFQNVIKSGDSTTEEVSSAYDSMNDLEALANNEMVLEDVIRSKGFENAVVKADEQEVQIFIDTEKLSQQQANEMIQLANEYLGTGRIISVKYSVGKK